MLHRSLHSDGDYKILGVLFDSQLLMHSASRVVATEAGWRLQKLLKARRYFSTPELVHLYKAQVLSYLESSTPGLYHAAPSVLDKIDRVQRRLLRALDLDETTALRTYKLAPLPSRRDMSMLGALHKVALGIAPPQLAALSPAVGVVEEPLQRQRLRHWRPLHNKQLSTHASFLSSEITRRSLFGLVHCYNRLPQTVVDARTVRAFQGRLQGALLEYGRSRAGYPSSPLAPWDWPRLYSTGWKALPRTELDLLFA